MTKHTFTDRETPFTFHKGKELTDLVDKEAELKAFTQVYGATVRAFEHDRVKKVLQAYEQAKLDKASLLGRSAGFKEEINLIFRDSKSETRPKLPTKKAGGAALGGSVCSVAYVTQADFNQLIDYLADKDKQIKE